VAGMGVVGVGLMLATIVGLTMAASYWYVSLPGSGTLPEGTRGDDHRMLHAGAVYWNRWVDRSGQWALWWRRAPRGEPIALRWEWSEDRINVNLPVWPVPLTVVLAGGWLWWSAARRAGRARWGSAALRTRVFAAAVLALGVVTGALVWASFLGWGGWYEFTDDYGRRGVWRGVAFNTKEKDWPSFSKGLPPAPGLFEIEWKRNGSSWDYRMPVWPLPLVALAAGAVVARRGERAWQASGAALCSACGYDLRGLAAGTRCPECGEGRACV
jgi:hypothetical protein